VFVRRAVEAAIRIGLVAALAVWCLRMFSPFVMPVLWAVIFAVALFPTFKKLRSWTGDRTKLAAILLTVLALAVVIVPTVMLSVSLVESVQNLSQKLEAGTLTLPPPGDRLRLFNRGHRAGGALPDLGRSGERQRRFSQTDLPGPRRCGPDAGDSDRRAGRDDDVGNRRALCRCCGPRAGLPAHDEVFAFVGELVGRPNARVIHPGPLHLEILEDICRRTGATGKLVADAHHAAVAIEHGCTMVTTDSDFDRFPGIRWQHPLRKK
jgi:hypothetical protein